MVTHESKQTKLCKWPLIKENMKYIIKAIRNNNLNFRLGCSLPPGISRRKGSKWAKASYFHQMVKDPSKILFSLSRKGSAGAFTHTLCNKTSGVKLWVWISHLTHMLDVYEDPSIWTSGRLGVLISYHAGTKNPKYLNSNPFDHISNSQFSLLLSKTLLYLDLVKLVWIIRICLGTLMPKL